MFNNREKAIAAWLLIVFVIAFTVWLLFQRDKRSSLLGTLQVLSDKTILTIVTAMLLYVGLVVWLLDIFELWNTTLIKDTLLWLLTTALVLAINERKISKDEHYFRRLLLDNLTLLVVFQFVVNFYTFDFGVEFALLPILICVGVLRHVATRMNWKSVTRGIEIGVVAFGVFLFLNTLINMLSDFQGFATSDNLRAFLLPLLLTLAYMPFLYFLALFLAYQRLFIILDALLSDDKAIARYAKRKILALCHINLRKLNRFTKDNIRKFLLRDRNDIVSLIREFESGKTELKERDTPDILGSPTQ